MDPFLGEVRAFSFQYAPQGWAECDGSLLAIRSNTALFSLIGTMYGGNGSTTFALPDLRGRTVVGAGQGIGLSNQSSGQVSGIERVALSSAEVPAHTHRLNYKVVANSNTPMTGVPSTTVFPSRTTSSTTVAATGFAKPAAAIPVTQMAPQMLSGGGGSQMHENRQPYLGLRYCIATSGVFPQRQ